MMLHAVMVMSALVAGAPCRSGVWDPDVVRAASQQGETQVLQVKESRLAPASNKLGTDAMVPAGIPQANLVRGDGCILTDEEALELVHNPAVKAHVQAHLDKGSRTFRLAVSALAAGVFGLPAAFFAVGAALGAMVGLGQLSVQGRAAAPVEDALLGGFIVGGAGVVLGIAWLVGGILLVPWIYKDKERGPALEEVATAYNEALEKGPGATTTTTASVPEVTAPVEAPPVTGTP